MSSTLPVEAEVVVIGGGIMGASTAYHLVARGVKGVVLLERDKLTSGTTWHSAAQVRQLRSSENLTRLIRYSAELYARLEAETGQSTGWLRTGSLSIATNPDRRTHIRRQAALANAFNVEAEVVGPADAGEIWPLMRRDDVLEAVWSPGDGRVNPSDLVLALIKGARARGLTVIENTPVTGFRVRNGRIAAVETVSGSVACEKVVNCAGLWGREVASRAGVCCPLYACEHFYLLTQPIGDGLPHLPTLSDHDGCLYIRDDVGGLLVGCFEPNPKPIALNELPRNFAFDLLEFDHLDLRPLPLSKRKRLLRRLLPTVGYLRYVDHVEAHGARLFEQAARMGLEGLVAKRIASPYQSARSADWLKLPAQHSEDFVVIGHAPAKTGGGAFGALLLAARRGENWVYVGRVGSGLGEAERDVLAAEFEGLERPDAPAEVADAPAGTRWLRPRLVVEVRYKEFTPGGQLRQPVLLRLRGDKQPEDCVVGPWRNDDLEPAVVTESLQRERVIFSNRDKVFWPESGYTKGDLIDYYRAIAPWMLPYLADRPVVLTRYPDGIDGKSFYQHRAPDFLPDWIRREPIWSDSDREEREYIVIDDEDTLLYIANLGAIPIHVWHASAADLARVDWCVLDLDPKEAPFSDVVKVARVVREICEEADLAAFLKTSGSTGLHVLIPVRRQFTHDQAKAFGELLARVCVARVPEVATIQRHVELREGRVYIDYLQNGHGKTIAAPFCVRPLPGAPVSMPLRWSELGARARPERYHLRNAPARMRALKEDPNRGLLEAEFDPAQALTRLQAMFDG